ncbi:MAG: hypothetical protein C0511_00070 [Hyphomicrobium sp.]|nr:hypothetical protein [Hyphomicrobium sp.]PPC84262.1 MAG: hypothetical protein CTY40_00070 [Hyphomicrobium sp.]
MILMRRPTVLLSLPVLALTVMATAAMAQQGPGGQINPGRDCQTVVACKFAKSGSYRGCISAYSCRVCKLVASRCNVGASSRKCQEFRCSWGA